MLAHTKHLSLMDQAGLAYSLEIKGQRVDIWATPAGCVLPTSIDAESGVRNIMITHDDFDFKGMYPGAHELHEIENCDMLVNGHMHHPTPMVLKGRTACHNPGSIMRVAIDLRDHQPVVSVWSPAHGVSLESVPLVVTANVFDMTGYEADAATPKELRAALPKGLRLSSFAAQLRVNDSLEAARTDDGSVLIESLAGYFKQFEKPDNLKRYLTQLVDETLKDREVA